MTKKRLEHGELYWLAKIAEEYLDTGKWEVHKPIYVRCPLFGAPRFSCVLKEVK